MSTSEQWNARTIQLENNYRHTIATRSGLSESALLHISELLTQIENVEITDLRDSAVDEHGNGLVGAPEWSAYMHATDILDDARRLADQLVRMARTLHDGEAAR
jgi:hypothetical protein